jgi:hypothetical protein
MKTIILAPQERIEAYELTARAFFRDVLDMDYGECLTTDESRLSDFSSCGLPDDIADATQGLSELYSAWNAWVVPVIFRQYGLAVSPRILLVELFEQIEQLRQVH